MSTTRHPRPTRPGRNPTRRPDAADDALSRLIANAAPPRDYLRELRGEKEAVAAFAKARLHPAEPRRRLMSAGKLLALKTLIAVIGLSGGSVAVAAATAHLPAQLDGHPSAVSSASPTASARADAQRDRHHPATLSPPVRGRSAAHGKGRSDAKSKSAHVSHKPKTAKKLPKPHPNGKPPPHPKGKPPPHPNGKPAPHHAAS